MWIIPILSRHFVTENLEPNFVKQLPGGSRKTKFFILYFGSSTITNEDPEDYSVFLFCISYFVQPYGLTWGSENENEKSKIRRSLRPRRSSSLSEHWVNILWRKRNLTSNERCCSLSHFVKLCAALNDLFRPRRCAILLRWSWDAETNFSGEQNPQCWSVLSHDTWRVYDYEEHAIHTSSIQERVGSSDWGNFYRRLVPLLNLFADLKLIIIFTESPPYRMSLYFLGTTWYLNFKCQSCFMRM